MSIPLRSRTCPPARASRSRLLALCLSSATLLAVVAPLSAGPARAAADADGWTDVALVGSGDPTCCPVRDTALDLPEGPTRPLTTGDPTLSLFTRGVSASGDRVVTIETSNAASGGVVAQRLVVRDISGALVRVLASLSGDTTRFETAALSPSGGQVAWSTEPAFGSDSGAPVVRAAAVTGGPARTIAGAVAVRGFAAEDLVVVSTAGPGLATADPAGTLTPITFLDGGAPDWRDLSRDGTRLVFARSPLVNGRVDLRLFNAPVTRAGSAVTVGMPTLLTPGEPTIDTQSPQQPNFTRDGSGVVFLRGDSSPGRVSIARVPSTGGPITVLATTQSGPYALGRLQVGARETAPPAAPIAVGSAIRRGPTATIPYTVAPDPTSSLLVAVRTSPGLPAKTMQALVPNPIVDTGVVSGRTYTYTLRQVDRSGNTGPAITTVLRQSAPAAAVRVSGQQLTAGQFLRSANGVRLRVNPDGNLVVLSPRGSVLFQTRTRGANPVLRVNADGNLVLLSGSRVLWHSRTHGQGAVVLVAQDDGNVVLYRDRDGRALWSSRSGRAY